MSIQKSHSASSDYFGVAKTVIFHFEAANVTGCAKNSPFPALKMQHLIGRRQVMCHFLGQRIADL